MIKNESSFSKIEHFYSGVALYSVRECMQKPADIKLYLDTGRISNLPIPIHHKTLTDADHKE